MHFLGVCIASPIQHLKRSIYKLEQVTDSIYYLSDHNCSQGKNKDALRDIDFKIDDLSVYAGGIFNDRFSSWKCGPV